MVSPIKTPSMDSNNSSSSSGGGGCGNSGAGTGSTDGDTSGVGETSDLSIEIPTAPDFSPFITFGEEKGGDFRRREHISHLNTPKHESIRKKLLSLVKDVTWNQSLQCSGVSVAHLYHQKRPKKLMIGLLKMEPKSVKHTQFSGPVCHRFVVLLGEVNIRINESCMYRDYGVNTIIRIGSQTSYSIENIQNDDTYLFFKSVTSEKLIG